MANDSLRGRVNRRLHYAQLHLALGGQARDESAQQSLLESALWHMVSAYRLYLGEIAATFQTAVQAQDARGAAQQLKQSKQRDSGEYTELVGLEEQADSWLAAALAAFAALDRAPDAPAAAGMIARAAAGNGQQLNVENCQRWLDELKALIAQQRSRLEEW